MEKCKYCPFYDAAYDEMMQGTRDVLIDGDDNANLHFCIIHPDGISESDICEDKPD